MKRNLISLAAILPAILSCMLILPHTASAQVSGNYDLSSYKLPDIRYQQLETEFNISGTNNSQNIDDQKDLERYYETRAGANYNSFLNTRKIQRYQTFNLDLTGRSSYDKDSIRYTDYTSFYPSLSYNIYNKWYFPNKLFLATGAYTRYHYGHIRNKYEYYDTTNTIGDKTVNEHTISLRIPLQFGVGRVEQVQDYYEAIYIYEDLLKNGRAVAGKSPQEVMELATLISQLENRRYFDSRIRNIEDIERLDSFLIANNFKTQSDARYFATLVDNWNFVTHFVRESGTSIALAVNPEFNSYSEGTTYNLIDENYKNISKSYGAEGGIVFEYHKPINLYWQTNTSVSAKAGIMHIVHENIYNFTKSKDTSNAPELNLRLTHSLEYYPNTRTRMTASINAGYFKYFDETQGSEFALNPGNLIYNAGFSLMLDYYFSQRLRLNANASLSYRGSSIHEMPSLDRNSLYSGFGVRLAYAIF